MADKGGARLPPMEIGMSFKLYNAPQSTCSQRVRFVLNAKELPFEEVKLDLSPAISSSPVTSRSTPTAWCRRSTTTERS
jgi:hypothetical protein